MNWTKEQKNAIDLPVSDLIVSAAAGSGKTAVMAERILTRITGDNSVDIDKILVVTYTSAAAAEIKERIMKKIMEELSKKRNEVLHNQLIKLPYAHISTIHSFCLNLIKKYFYLLDIDPSVKIADETEIEMLKTSAVNAVFEKHYNSSDSEFLRLISDYSSRKDTSVSSAVVELYDFSRTMPDSEEWIRSLTDMYCDGSRKCTDFLMKSASLAGKLAMSVYRSALKMCDDIEDGEKIKHLLTNEIMALEETLSSQTYGEMYSRVSELTFGRWPTYKGESRLVPIVRAKRDEAKKIFKEKIKEKYILFSPDDIKKDNEMLLPHIRKYQELVFEFAQVFESLKKEKNIIDFSDFEHLALRLLRNPDGTPSEIADSVSEEFEEIYIDEYQDCNNIQNAIFECVSGSRFGKNNMFCVGDIKQSIYSFRDSNPLLFRDKCDRFPLYTDCCNPTNKILLNSNFRSRETIVNFVNSLFTQIMSPECGDITYNEDEFLRYGAGYDHFNDDTDYIDIALIDEDNGFDKGNVISDSGSLSPHEAEAAYIAGRINEMISQKYLLADKKNDGSRPAQYRDFVVLLRSAATAAPVFEKVFSDMGIPAYSDKGESYFDTEEINFLISFLKIVDNPDDDIALVSVMKNPIFSFDENVLMKIRLNSPHTSFYKCIKKYAYECDDYISRKLSLFLERLSDYYFKSRYMDTDEFLSYLMKDINFYVYLSTFPDAKLKKTNVKFLMKKAREFEKSNFRGIYSFVNFVENIGFGNKAESAKVLNENDNVVRIMSIHKSKGLEFPVVFVSCLGKKFNKQHLRDSVSMHKELGVGMDCVYREDFIKVSTANKLAIKLKSDFESVSEELRVLYVALTRATEKLILTACTDNASRMINRTESSVSIEDTCVNPYLIYTSPSFLQMLMYGVVRSDGYPSDFDYFTKINDGCKYNITYMNIDEIEYNTFCDDATDWQQCYEGASDKYRELADKLSFEYVHSSANLFPSNMTVTELKKRKMEEDEVYSPFDDVNLAKPKMFGSLTHTDGAGYGTLVHFIMEKLDFKSVKSPEDIVTQLDKLHSDALIDESEYKLINPQKIFGFFCSDIGKRMCADNISLNKEFSFKYLESASEFFDVDTDEKIVIQGTIDVFFEDYDGRLVVVDYKTDKITGGDTTIIAKRYCSQLDYYAKALMKITGKTVKEKILYLFDNGEAISV